MKKLSNKQLLKKIDEHNDRNEEKIRRKDEKLLVKITKTFIKAVNHYNNNDKILSSNK